MKPRPRRIRARRAGTDEQWRIVGVLSAAEDMHLAGVMPDDTARVLSAAREHTVSVTFHAVDPGIVRVAFGIPDGFPLWYRTPRLALPAPPVRLALPWGDSCYTTAVFAQVDGWPQTTWCHGPVTSFTASSEGPRCQARGDEYMVRRWCAVDGVVRG